MTDFLYLFLLLVILPVSHSESTVECDLYQGIPNEKDLRDDNPIVQSFLSKYPDSKYSSSIQESMPPLGVIMFSENLKDKITLTITTNECSVPVDYKLEKGLDIFIILTDIGWPNGTPDGVTSYSDSEITDIVQEYLNYTIYQKWLNHKGDIVYVFPESVSTLTERGYLTEKSVFFDFEKLKIPCNSELCTNLQ